MQWEHPRVLLLFWLVPLLGVLLVLAERRRQQAVRRFADPEMLRRLLPTGSPVRTWLRGGAFLAGVALLVLAAARPRFGVFYERVTSRGADVLVLLDVSRSMLAEDVVPSRLERAKSDIRDLLREVRGDRVGLIAFAGAPVVTVPLTTDHGYFTDALAALGTGTAPRGGSLIGDAIRKGLASLPREPDRDHVMLLITDGEDHDSFPLEAAEQAAGLGVKIFTVGLGDVGTGQRIPVRDPQGGQQFLKYEGQEVWSRMDEALLKEIALKTGGAYVPARTRAYDLGLVYREHLAGLTRGELASEKRKRYAEQYQWFVAVGLALLLLDLGLPRYRPRSSADGPA